MTDTEQLEIADRELRFTIDKLAEIFMPLGSLKRKQRFPTEDSKGQFVHYTTAENAIKIIESKRIWMRNTTCMSDYREVEHGYDLLRKVFASTASETQSRYNALKEVMDACIPEVFETTVAEFNEKLNQIRFNAYVASVSEHDSGDEDLYGRLSMWRAFGGSSGQVALIFSVPWYSPGIQHLGLMFSPVVYLNEDGLRKEMDCVTRNVRANAEYLSRVEHRQALVGIFYTMLLSMVTCIKHSGFHEEREWRLIHGPFPLHSDLMENNIECIRGIPQRVFKVPLESKISPELEFSALFSRMVIGPTQYASSMHAAFTAKLAEAGVLDAASKIVISDIPIRT